MKNFLNLDHLRSEELGELLDLAGRLERSPEPEALRGKVLGLLFLNPSLRTLASFQSGMARLGGSSFVITPDSSWNLEMRDDVPMVGNAAEHVREAIPVLASYADALGVRAFAGGTNLQEDLGEPLFSTIEPLCPVPLINMESAVNHPCQALADWKTLDDEGIPAHNGRFVLSWADHPRALPLAVPSAIVHMAAMRGMDVTVLRPDGFGLPEPVMARARAAAEASGGSLSETDDRQLAMEGAHVLYAKSWSSMTHYGTPEAEAQARSKLSGWTVDETWFDGATPDCVFMHCLPVRRDVVVRSEVLDGRRSRVIRQAANRMYAQMAVLRKLMSNRET